MGLRLYLYLYPYRNLYLYAYLYTYISIPIHLHNSFWMLRRWQADVHALIAALKEAGVGRPAAEKYREFAETQRRSLNSPQQPIPIYCLYYLENSGAYYMGN